MVTWPYFDDLIADGSPIVNNFNHEHINYFSKQTADTLFARAGFKSCDYHISLSVCKDDALQFSNISVYKNMNEGSLTSNGKDINTGDSIKEYIERISRKDNMIREVIRRIAEERKKVVIWGSGAYLYYLMGNTVLSDCEISFIVDNNRAKIGKEIYGYEIKSPEALTCLDGGVVLVTAMLYAEEIGSQIAEMGNHNLEVIKAF